VGKLRSNYNDIFGTFAELAAKEPMDNMNQLADARGRFVIAGLSAGDYELTLAYQSRLPSSGTAGGAGGVASRQVKQNGIGNQRR
jgi:hypothetical protein